ncbi:MAG: cellulase family glycosylhydrolase [candidate division KSB1 bacterium]|nr:cellulase family glycosylhydrolase [candidate division KSB1 bacterium]
MKPNARLWSALTGVLLCGLLPVPSLAFLKAQGERIIDTRTGEEVILRGLGLGGWLVPEGYMLRVPGFGSPTSIRNLIADLLGPQLTDEFFQQYRAHYVAEEDVARIAQWGFNSIRLPFHYALLTPPDQPGVYLEEGFQLLDRVVEWCRKYHLYLILDMHCAPGGQNKENHSDSDGIEARLWTDPSNQDRVVDIWRRIAERYAQEEWIGGYDLLNEPVLPSGHSTTELRLLYMRITQAIREVDPNHMVFIEGNWYATDFSNLTPPFDVNLCYSFHKYWNEPTLPTIQYLLDIRRRYHTPLWLGESGENSNPWFGTCIRLMEQNKIGWCWWTHKKFQTLTSPFSAPITAEYQRVLDYWNGRAARPDAELARRALFGMAEQLKLENCVYHPDVVDALLRPGFTTEPVPYSEHRLPGRLLAVEYDMGNEGVAYHDTDYWKTKGLTSGEQWNRGSVFRNDGVDIEASGDTEGNGYSVGWIEAGEWLKFTVQVDVEGTYTVRLRVASPQATGSVQLFLDDSPLAGPIAIPSTGGWKNWQYIDGPTVTLPSGRHVLKLLFPTGGFNLNLVDFRIAGASVKQMGMFQELRSGLWIGRPHPNPVGERLAIPVLSNEEMPLRVQIFDSMGGLVATVHSGEVRAGLRNVTWDGRNAEFQRVPSGVYVCVLESGGRKLVQKLTVVH